MNAVILTIHSLIVLALVGVVLLQRSEGGAALGLGGGGGGAGGGFMSGRGAANMLTRSTSVLAALFFTTSMVLALLTDTGETPNVQIARFGIEAPTELNPGALQSDDILDIFGDDPAEEDGSLDLMDVLNEDQPAPAEEAGDEPPADDPSQR